MNTQNSAKKNTVVTNFIETCLNRWADSIKTKKIQDSSNITPSLELPEENNIVEIIEKAIRTMPAHLRNVIEKYYLCSGTIKQKAEELKIARVTFHEYLRMAKYWLLGYWSKVTSPNGKYNIDFV